MSDSHGWVEALKIKPEDLAIWNGQVPEGTPLLVWCLSQGLIPATAYLAWASPHYGLPILSPGYFDHAVVGENLLHKHQGQYTWSPWFFPVAEWERTTFVACVEPPSESISGWAFVLCEPKSLMAMWQRMHPNLEHVNVNLQVPATPPAEVGPVDGPSGLQAESKTKVFSLNLDNLGIANAPSTVAPSSTPPPPPAAPPAPPAVASEPEPAEPVTLSSMMPLHKLDVTTIDIPSPVVAAAPAEAPVQAAPAPSPTPVPAASAPPPPRAPAPPSAVKKQEAQPKRFNPNDALQAFEKLRAFYQTSVIFQCAGGMASLVMTDPNLASAKCEIGVDLNQPSFLRIVMRTQQPYHGFVVDSPTHQEIFRTLNFEQSPTCITAIPLKQNNEIWAIVVAFGDSSAQNATTLAKAVSISEKVTPTEAQGKPQAA